MIKYGLPIVAALILTLSVFAIVKSQPVHATVAPPSPPPAPVEQGSVGAVGLVEASSENIAVSLPRRLFTAHTRNGRCVRSAAVGRQRRGAGSGGIPPSKGNSTVPACARHSSLGTATMRPSVFRQLPDPS